MVEINDKLMFEMDRLHEPGLPNYRNVNLHPQLQAKSKLSSKVAKETVFSLSTQCRTKEEKKDTWVVHIILLYCYTQSE